MKLYRSVLHVLLLLPLLCRAGPDAPESATGWTPKLLVTVSREIMIAAHPLASQAGSAILRRGGSAIDAAIAAQAVLGLVEPQSSGIGGGAFMVYYDGRRVRTFDGRETAPAAARPDRFLVAGKPAGFRDAVTGGRSVGVPGLLAMLDLAHRNGGRLPWKILFEPAIRLARSGFPVSARLHALLAGEQDLHTSLYYLPDGQPKPVGRLVRNPAYARVLDRIAREGAAAFYRPPLARAIVQAVNGAPRNPGDLALDDFRRYRPVERDPVCGDYRGYRLCGMGPPSSGGVAVLQILGLMARFPMGSYGPLSVDAVSVFSDAGRLAFADRARYLADPAFVPVPVKGLLDPGYLARRSLLIDPQASPGVAPAGVPPGAVPAGRDTAIEQPSTTQIIAIDRWGRAVSMTSSIEDRFGSRILVNGFLLNNQLTDFSFDPLENGLPVANRVEGGKRPRSAMAPMLVFDGHGRLQGAVGAPGGSLIINYVAQTLVALLDWHLDPQAAVSLPHYGSRNGATELEAGRGLDGLIPALAARGDAVRLIEMNSGLAAAWRTRAGWQGGADPRREGQVSGD